VAPGNDPRPSSTISYTDPELLHPEDLVWPVGINNLRIQYTAGYNVIPEAKTGHGQ